MDAWVNNLNHPELEEDNPAGIGITPTIHVSRLNRAGLWVVAMVLTCAAIIATLTFNKQPEQAQTKPPAKAVDDSRPYQGWWDERPDDEALEEPVQLRIDPPPQVTTVAPVAAAQLPAPRLDSASPAPTTPRDPAEEQRKQRAMQALTAGLSVSGFGASFPGSTTSAAREEGGAHNQQFALTALADQLRNGQKPQVDDPNGQNEKREFLKTAGDGPEYHREQLRVPADSKHELKAGTLIPGVLISGMNSDLPGQILAQVRENVRDTATGNNILIPMGSKLVGIYDSNIAFGQNRILVAWNRVIYPDGSSLNLKGMPGVDNGGFAGIEDIVDHHYLKIFGSAALMSAISAGVQLSQPNSGMTSFGGSTQGPGPAQVAAGSLGQQLGQTGMQIIQKNMNIQPTIIIRNGEPFNIFVTADIYLPTNKIRK